MAAAIVAALSMASCGGGGDTTSSATTSDQDQIAAAIQLEGTSSSPSVCREVISQAALQRLGGQRGCVSAVAGNDAHAESITAIHMAGKTAVAHATVHGGVNDGCVYGLSMVREGGKWKVDSQTAITQKAICLK
jgi:hypothetical protein